MRGFGTNSVSPARALPFKEEAPDSRVGLSVHTNPRFSVSGPLVNIEVP